MNARPAVLVCLLVAAATGPLSAQDRVGKPEAGASLFDSTRVWTVQLTIPAGEYAAMQPVSRGVFTTLSPPAPKAADGSPRQIKRSNFGTELAWAKGDAVVNGAVFAGIGLRYKGNGTIIDAANTIKKSIKIDLGHFGAAGRFQGVKTIYLHCEVTDPSKCREALGYALYRSAGVPGPRTAFAEVRLTVPGKYDRELLGLYTVVEPIDKAFLRAHFGTDDGLLMKPEGLREFVDLGDNWDRYKKTYVPNRDATPDEAKRIIAFARLVAKGDDAAFAREVGSYLDVDSYLRFLAVTAFIVNSDNFFNLGHNAFLYLHPRTGRLHVIPWDLDRAFANFFLFGSTRQQMNLRMAHPYSGNHRLTERVLALPGVGDRYRVLLADLAATSFAKARLVAEVERLSAATRDLIARDGKASEARKEVGQGVAVTPTVVPPPDLKVFVERRTAAVASQLAGASMGHIPSQAIKLGDLLAEPALPLLDADKDGRLSKAEWLAAAKAVFSESKKDDAGRTDEQGLMAALNKQYAPTAGTKPRTPGGFWPGNLLAGPIVKLADGDNDKKVSLAELLAAADKLFDQFDPAKTGHLDEQAFGEMLNSLFPSLAGLAPGPKKGDDKP